MTNSNRFRRLILVVASIATVILLEGLVAAQAQNSLFRQQPVPTAPGRHNRLAHIGDLDEEYCRLAQSMTIEFREKPSFGSIASAWIAGGRKTWSGAGGWNPTAGAK
jgi:hypothetical protein